MVTFLLQFFNIYVWISTKPCITSGGGHDYEECRLLKYKPPVVTSQETHYVSVTEPSGLMLCKI
jgi:hypothetical protein